MGELFLTVRPLPHTEEMAACRAYVCRAFDHSENRSYLAHIETDRTPSSVARERWGALSLLPGLLAAAGVDAHTLILRRDEHGRPYADGCSGLLDFNLSHTSTHAACALLVGGGRVGLDVEEVVPPARATAMLDRFGTEGERAWLASDPTADFTRLWTLREAIAKADGRGQPLSFDATRPPDAVCSRTARLAGTGTSLALCTPTYISIDTIHLLPDSLPLVWDE